MKRTTKTEFTARHMVDGKCVASVLRTTAAQAIDALGEVSSGSIEVWRVDSRLHSVGKWWTETGRSRVDGGDA